MGCTNKQTKKLINPALNFFFLSLFHHYYFTYSFSSSNVIVDSLMHFYTYTHIYALTHKAELYTDWLTTYKITILVELYFFLPNNGYLQHRYFTLLKHVYFMLGPGIAWQVKWSIQKSVIPMMVWDLLNIKLEKCWFWTVCTLQNKAITNKRCEEWEVTTPNLPNPMI